MTSSPPTTLPSRQSDSHKGTYGRVLLIGGSRGMAGSVALSSIAALHSGSGLVSAAVPDCILETVAGFHPAVMTIPVSDEIGHFSQRAWPEIRVKIKKQDAIGIGPGMSTGDGSVAIVEGLLDQRIVPVVIDADALNVIAEQAWFADTRFVRGEGDPDIVLTPHRGELERLTGVPASEPESQLRAVENLAESFGFTVILKGAPTLVVSGRDCQQKPYTNSTGNPGMATAGSGDVLTGIVTSLMGQGLSGWNAARLGVWIHGVAGDETAQQKSMSGMTAMHLVETLASVSDRMHSKE